MDHGRSWSMCHQPSAISHVRFHPGPDAREARAGERIDFSKIKTTVPIPNLIEIQKKSYERFLQMNRLPSEREDAGLQSVFKSVFPISDFRENSSLEFIEYSIGN